MIQKLIVIASIFASVSYAHADEFGYVMSNADVIVQTAMGAPGRPGFAVVSMVLGNGDGIRVELANKANRALVTAIAKGKYKGRNCASSIPRIDLPGARIHVGFRRMKTGGSEFRFSRNDESIKRPHYDDRLSRFQHTFIARTSPDKKSVVAFSAAICQEARNDVGRSCRLVSLCKLKKS